MEVTAELKATDRAVLLRRGVYLNAILLAWNVIEGIVAVGSGIVAGSVAARLWLTTHANGSIRARRRSARGRSDS